MCPSRNGSGTRRRWRWTAAFATTAAIAGAIAFYVGRERPCDGADAELAEVWNAERRTAIGNAFAASERPYAHDTWLRVSDRLDHYAADWTAMYRDACQATRVLDQQSEAMLDRRMVCLDRRRQRLVGALQVLERGDAEAVDHATEVGAGLDLIEACGDIETLQASVSPPATLPMREEVANVRRTLADADALLVAGHHREAAASSDAALEVARSLGYTPVLVEALASAGECHERLGEVAQARALLDEAVWTGIAIGYDEYVARVVASLTWIAGEHDRDLPAAEDWAARGRAVLERIGDPARRATQLHNALGVAYTNAARYDDALQSYELALRRAGDDPDLELHVASAHSNIGKLWRLRGDLERAHLSFEQAATILEARLGADHPMVARTQVEIGQVLDAFGRHDAAVTVLKRSVAALERTANPSAELAGALLDLGAAHGHMEVDNFANAAQLRALAMLEEIGDELGLAHALLIYGESCLDQKIYDAAESQFERAIELFERTAGPDAPQLGFALVGLGYVRQAQSRPDEALGLYRRAHEIGAAQGPNNRLTALTNVAIAVLHRGQGRYEEALAALDRTDAILTALPNPLAEDRLLSATERVLVAVDRGRVADDREAVVALDALLVAARSARVSNQRSGEGYLALGRARLGLGELAEACNVLARAVAALEASRTVDRIPEAKSALADCEAREQLSMRKDGAPLIE